MAITPRSSATRSSQPARRGRMATGDKPKLIAAAAMFVVAGGLVLWQQGLFDHLIAPSHKPAPALIAKLADDIKQNHAAVEQLERAGKVEIGGE